MSIRHSPRPDDADDAFAPLFDLDGLRESAEVAEAAHVKAVSEHTAAAHSLTAAVNRASAAKAAVANNSVDGGDDLHALVADAADVMVRAAADRYAELRSQVAVTETTAANSRMVLNAALIRMPAVELTGELVDLEAQWRLPAID